MALTCNSSITILMSLTETELEHALLYAIEDCPFVNKIY